MKPTRVSYSAISMYEECPAKYKYSYIDGLDTPVGPAAHRGTRLHQALEKYLKGKLAEEALPVDFWRIKSTLVEFKKLKARSEEEWCALADWTKCEEKHPEVWIKAVIDVRYRIGKTLFVWDLKTGRIYPEHVDQLQLYSTVALSRLKDVNEVVVGGLYADEGKKFHETTYPRKMLPFLQQHWTERGQAVLKDNRYDPNPSPDNCKYCPFSKHRGGPCLKSIG